MYPIKICKVVSQEHLKISVTWNISVKWLYILNKLTLFDLLLSFLKFSDSKYLIAYYFLCGTIFIVIICQNVRIILNFSITYDLFKHVHMCIICIYIMAYVLYILYICMYVYLYIKAKIRRLTEKYFDLISSTVLLQLNIYKNFTI